MAVRGVDHHEIDAGLDQPLGAVEALVADRGRGGDAQAPLLVLAGVRIGDRLLDVLHRDQADAAILVVDHQQLLDPVLVQEALGLVLADALAHGDEPLLGHQLGHLLARVGGEAHVAVGEDADELAGAAVAAALHHRDAGDAVVLHQCQRIGERGVGIDGHRVDHHAGFELLDLADLRGLLLGLEIAVDDAEPPACAMAIAILASVTVSMAEATIGILSGMSRVMRVRMSASDGSSSDSPGFSSTSSKVSASRRVPLDFAPSPTPVARLAGLLDGTVGDRDAREPRRTGSSRAT